jgi:hypothetical protein
MRSALAELRRIPRQRSTPITRSLRWVFSSSGCSIFPLRYTPFRWAEVTLEYSTLWIDGLENMRDFVNWGCGAPAKGRVHVTGELAMDMPTLRCGHDRRPNPLGGCPHVPHLDLRHVMSHRRRRPSCRQLRHRRRLARRVSRLANQRPDATSQDPRAIDSVGADVAHAPPAAPAHIRPRSTTLIPAP